MRPPAPTRKGKKGKGLNVLLRELSDDDDDGTMADVGLDLPADPQRPWLSDYHGYIDVPEQVPEGWSAIQWWGVSISVSTSGQKNLEFHSTIHNAFIQPGAPLHGITWQLCHHQYQVNACSRRAGSQSQNVVIV